MNNPPEIDLDTSEWDKNVIRGQFIITVLGLFVGIPAFFIWLCFFV